MLACSHLGPILRQFSMESVLRFDPKSCQTWLLQCTVPVEALNCINCLVYMPQKQPHPRYRISKKKFFPLLSQPFTILHHHHPSFYRTKRSLFEIIGFWTAVPPRQASLRNSQASSCQLGEISTQWHQLCIGSLLHDLGVGPKVQQNQNPSKSIIEWVKPIQYHIPAAPALDFSFS